MEIKIAFSHQQYPAAGTEKVTEGLAAYLAGRGYKVYVFVEKLREELLSPSDRASIEFIPTVFGRKNTPQLIADELNSRGIDIFVLPFIWHVDPARLRKLTSAKIVFTNHMQGLQETGDFFIRHRMQAARDLRAGKIHKTLVWYLLRLPFEILTGRKRRHVTARHRKAYLNSDLYTVICEPYKQSILKAFGEERGDDHIAAIGNWIPPREYDTGEKENVVLYVGRLNGYQKRLDRLIDIWAGLEGRFPDWELWIVGQGEERENLMRQTGRLGLGRVRFIDYTPDPGEYYRRASIFALTSSNEAWGLVISEAQQAGVVPIAFDVSAGVHVQIAPSGVNGVLVPPFDVGEYARELARLMGDDALRGQMSRNVILKAREYSDPARLEKWNVEFRKLLNRP
jgi:glycosyltransferase involved in cell wall biosynthesis